MNEPAVQLEYATTAELIEELARRSDAMVIGHVPKSGGGQFGVHHSGHPLAALGLAEAVRRNLRKTLDKAAKEPG